MTSRSLGAPFWRFWTASALANVGDGIRLAAFPLLAASLTPNPLSVAMVVAAQSLPWLVTGLAAGVLADRRPPRTLVAGADLGRVLVLGLLVVAVAGEWATVGLVAVCAFLLGVGETVRDTAAQTAIPRLVPSLLLERANGRLVAAEVVGNEFLGPPLGSALFVAGAALPFMVNGASLALAVMLVVSLPLSLVGTPPATEGQSETPRGVRGGIAWLARHRLLRTLVVVTAAVVAADSAWYAILVLYTRDVLEVGAEGFGMLLATGALGGVLGSVIADRVIGGRRHRVVLGVSIAVTTGVPPVLLVAPHVWAAVVVVVATSGAFAVFNVAALSMRHRLVPDGLVGRVTAATRTVVYGAGAAGAVGGGAVAAASGLHAPFAACGVVAVVATVAWWCVSRGAWPEESPTG